MEINFSRFNKKELSRLREMVMWMSVKLEHQRGTCTKHRCETCIYTDLCKLLLDIQDEAEKRL